MSSVPAVREPPHLRNARSAVRRQGSSAISRDEMTFAEFERSLKSATPPPGLAPALVALWWAQKNDWDQAHTVVMNEESREAAWVHAYLHRVEGDADNAAYWYRQAKKPVASGALAAEWQAIATALLGEG
jgi:hypothetical protein